MISNLVHIAIGGALGSVLRYITFRLVPFAGFPLGTLIVNGKRVFEYHSFNYFVPACLLRRNRLGKEFINPVFPACIYTGCVVINYD